MSLIFVLKLTNKIFEFIHAEPKLGNTPNQRLILKRTHRIPPLSLSPPLRTRTRGLTAPGQRAAGRRHRVRPPCPKPGSLHPRLTQETNSVINPPRTWTWCVCHAREIICNIYEKIPRLREKDKGPVSIFPGKWHILSSAVVVSNKALLFNSNREVAIFTQVLFY